MSTRSREILSHPRMMDTPTVSRVEWDPLEKGSILVVKELL
jgi:hypothetical protein